MKKLQEVQADLVLQAVKLVSITQGAGELAGASAQEIISYTARVSNPANQTNFKTAPKLLAYLIKHKHWSPFEMASMTLQIKTSRGIAAQILRHRSFSFQEFSQRYQEVSDFALYPARRQDVKNKQNSIDDMSPEDKQWFLDAQTDMNVIASGFYNEALQRGIAKEQARFLLTLGTETVLYMTGSARSWITYFLVRLDKSTQLEHRQIALECWEVFKINFPDVSEVLKKQYPEIFPK